MHRLLCSCCPRKGLDSSTYYEIWGKVGQRRCLKGNFYSSMAGRRLSEVVGETRWFCANPAFCRAARRAETALGRGDPTLRGLLA